MFFVDNFQLVVCFITYTFELIWCDLTALCFNLHDVSHELSFPLFCPY